MALIIEIRVVPSSGRSGCVMDSQYRLKCMLKSPAEKGKANKELIAFLAKSLGFPQSSIQLIRGETQRTKLIKIDRAITLEQLYSALGIEQQSDLFK